MEITKLNPDDFEKVMSLPRFSTYIQLTKGDKFKAIELYNWNLLLASEFFILLNIYEISLRNACVEAIKSQYGENWFRLSGFHYTIKYESQKEIIKLSQKYNKEGKVVAELKFAFWQSLFDSARDERIWNNEFSKVFPNYNKNLNIADARDRVYKLTGEIRQLRNRIAHHEPIITGKYCRHQHYLDIIIEIISWRNLEVADFYKNYTKLNELIKSNP